MTKKELKFILQEGEGFHIEFKEAIGGIDKDMVAFANASGGKIFLGIKDDNSIVGIKITNRLRSQIQDIANSCEPTIKIILEGIDDMLVVNVREGLDKPYKCSAGFYRRIGSNSQKLTRDEIIDFFQSEGKIKFDELTATKFSYPRDFDKDRLSKFLELAGISKSIKTEKDNPTIQNIPVIMLTGKDDIDSV